jgi:GxxExxY protein
MLGRGASWAADQDSKADLHDGRRKTARTQGAQGPEEKGGTLFRPDPRFGETPPEVNDAARRVVEAAVEVHRHLGPGYVESVYENALAVELGLRGIPFERQVAFRVAYKGHEVGEGRMDLLVECCLVVELKAVERITDVHLAQALSYLKATGRTLGLLINVNVPVLLRGVKRIVRNHPSIQMEGAPMAPEPRGAQT